MQIWLTAKGEMSPELLYRADRFLQSNGFKKAAVPGLYHHASFDLCETVGVLIQLDLWESEYDPEAQFALIRISFGNPLLRTK
jgi:hypothetical protein